MKHEILRNHTWKFEVHPRLSRKTWSFLGVVSGNLLLSIPWCLIGKREVIRQLFTEEHEVAFWKTYAHNVWLCFLYVCTYVFVNTLDCVCVGFLCLRMFVRAYESVVREAFSFWFPSTQGRRNVRAGGRQKKHATPQGSAARSGKRPKLVKNRPFKKMAIFVLLKTNGWLTGTKTKASLRRLHMHALSLYQCSHYPHILTNARALCKVLQPQALGSLLR